MSQTHDCSRTLETKEAQRKLKNDLITKAEVHIRSLACQGELARCVSENISRAVVEQWSRMLESLPDYLFRFVRKAFQQQLPTAIKSEKDGRELTIRTVHSVINRLCRPTSMFYRTARQPSIDTWNGTTKSCS